MIAPLSSGQLASVDIQTTLNERYVAELEERVDGNLKRAAAYVRGLLSVEVPVDKGSLQTGLAVKPIPKSKKNPVGGWRVAAEFYLFFYEYGTLGADGDWRQEPRQITAPLLQSHESQINDIITEGL